jgi:hypothetical protein
MATAASPAAAQWDIGIYAGPTLTRLSGSYVESSIHTWGFTGGLFLERYLSPHWSIEGGFNIISQKGGFEVVSASQPMQYDYRYNYLEIPLAINYITPFANDAWDFRGFVGATAAFGTECDVKPSTQFSFDTECDAALPGGEFEKFDLLINFGIGADRVFKGGSGFGFDIRYGLGTQNTLGEAEENGLSVMNRELDFRFRVFMPLSGPRR